MDEKEKILKKLDDETSESAVYIGYYCPKTQSELEKFLYNTPANITPLINARKKLTELQWVAPVSGFTGLRNIPLKSSPEPFIEYIKNLSKDRVSTKGEMHRLDKDDLKYVELFIGSDFFRKTFFGDYFLENGCGVYRGMIFRSIEGKLYVRNAFRCINNALQSVIIQSLFLFRDLKDFYLKNTKDIINNYSNFDTFLEKQFIEMQKKDLKSHILENPKIQYALDYCGYKIYPESGYYYDNVLFNGLFLVFPPKLAFKISAINRSGDLLSFIAPYVHYEQWEES